MGKRVTIKDIAKAAGVSIATVSYVINNKATESISEETRKKVIQWANIFGYTPNPNAVALANSKTKIFAFISSPSLSFLQKIDLLNFLEPFSSFVNMKGYRVLYTFQSESETISDVDAIICYNMTTNQFYSLGNANTIPLIAVDINLNDTLFYQINKDYELMDLEAQKRFGDDYTLIALKPQDPNVETEIINCFKNVRFVLQLEDLQGLMSELSNTNVLVYDHFLYSVFKKVHHEERLFYYSLRESERYRFIFDAIIQAIEREVDKEHFLKV